MAMLRLLGGLQARECLARGQAAGRRAPDDPKAAYDHLRAAHLNAVRASLEDHVARLEWPHQRIKHYRTERLRSLLAFARERSPFHAARMADIDPATATVEDLVRLPPMLKQEAQDDWTRSSPRPISTAPAPSGCWHSSAGSPTPPRNTGVQLRRLKRCARCVGMGLGAFRDARLPRLAVAGARRARFRVRPPSCAAGHARGRRPPHASTPLFDVGTRPLMETVVIPAAEPFDQVSERWRTRDRPTLWATPR